MPWRIQPFPATTYTTPIPITVWEFRCEGSLQQLPVSNDIKHTTNIIQEVKS